MERRLNNLESTDVPELTLCLHVDRLIRAGTNQECIQYTTPTMYDGLA